MVLFNSNLNEGLFVYYFNMMSLVLDASKIKVKPKLKLKVHEAMATMLTLMMLHKYCLVLSELFVTYL